MNFIPVLLEADGAATAGPANFLPTIFMLVAMVAIFYFLLYRPQKKQEKEAAAMKNSLEVGDEITTIGGIIGEIVSIKDETCVIETTRDKTKIRILKNAVSKVDVKASEKEA